MDRSLDSALDSALAAINLSGGSSLSEDFHLSPSGNLRSASLNQFLSYFLFYLSYRLKGRHKTGLL